MAKKTDENRVRAQVMLDPLDMERVDQAAERVQMSRSSFLAFLIEAAMGDEEFVIEKLKTRFVRNMREIFPERVSPTKLSKAEVEHMKEMGEI